MIAKKKGLTALAVGLALSAISSTSFGAATLIIQNVNAAGVGFNDPTPATPVGGNLGTTRGQQRLNAFQAAANKWGATLTSNVTIVVQASFEPLACTATSATLGSAGAVSVFRDHTGATFPNTLHSIALANKQAGVDLDPTRPDIRARFNSNLGMTNCLPGRGFYLGLDNNHGNEIDLINVLLHEFGHGLGFQTFTNGTSGAFSNGSPSVYDFFLFDNTIGKTWAQMTNAERATSALNARNLAWTGPRVSAGVPQLLAFGVPQLTLNVPGSPALKMEVGTANFGPLPSDPGVTAEIMPVVDNSSAGPACTPLNAANAAAVQGKIALVDVGVCNFNIKARNVQAAGALGMIVGDNVFSLPAPRLGGGPDDTVLIPAVRISQADAAVLKSALRFRSRTNSGVFGTIGVDLGRRNGADPSDRALMFNPNPFQGGSSISHFDTQAFPNLLMEPAINADLPQAVTLPNDLTFQALMDTGW